MSMKRRSNGVAQPPSAVRKPSPSGSSLLAFFVKLFAAAVARHTLLKPSSPAALCMTDAGSGRLLEFKVRLNTIAE